MGLQKSRYNLVTKQQQQQKQGYSGISLGFEFAFQYVASIFVCQSFIHMYFIFGCTGSLFLHVGFLYLWCKGFSSVVHGLSCPTACGIFPDQGSNPCPLHWQADGVLTTGLPGKSVPMYSCLFTFLVHILLGCLLFLKDLLFLLSILKFQVTSLCLSLYSFVLNIHGLHF